MMVQRLVLAFCCALAIHLLLILVPSLDENPLEPQLTGSNSIQISLASTSVTEIAPVIPEEEPEEPLQASPPLTEEISEEILEESMEAREEAMETVLPAAIQPQAEQQLKQIEVAANSSPASPTSEGSTTESVESTQDKLPPPIAAAAMVTSEAMPMYNKNPKPAYPTLARKRNWQGSVTLSIMVLENGTVKEVTVHQSSGHSMLDNSALKTVKTWSFLPGMKNGVPIDMKVQVTIHFKLD